MTVCYMWSVNHFYLIIMAISPHRQNEYYNGIILPGALLSVL